MKIRNNLISGYFIILLTILLSITGIFLASIIYSKYVSKKETLIASCSGQLEMQKEQIDFQLETIVSDLYILSEMEPFRKLLSGNPHHYIDAVEQIFKLMSTERRTYDQIRYIDCKGMETIRVNYNNGSPYIVPKDKLQFKGNRYYFKDTIALAEGEIFFSPLDLNIENGKIELPEKPVLRVGMPVFNAEGERKGIIIVNYYGHYIINNFANADLKEGEEIYLLNKEGYWLYSPYPEKNWAFMYNDRKNISFKNSFPDIWSKIKNSDHGKITDDKSVYIYNTASREGMYFWKIIGYLPESVFKNLLIEILKDLRIVITAAVLFSIILSILLTRLYLVQKNSRKQMEISLKEKELLLKEIHHRVKNSLTLVSSFVNLYNRNMPKKENDDFFDALQQKIDTISLVHSYLYQSSDFKNISLETYIEVLLQNMLNNFVLSNKSITLNLSIEKISMPAKMVISLGLIISELAMNSLKHAFPESSSGELNLKISKDDNYYTIVYSDNGKGLPENFSIETSDSLGMVIISSLTDQMNGRVEITTGKGGSFTFLIPAK